MRRRVTTLAGLLGLVAGLGGCLQTQWVVGVVSVTDRAMIVRIALATGTTDFLVEAHAEGTLMALPSAPLPASAMLVDPETCVVHDEVDLSAERTWIAITEEPYRLSVAAKRNLAADRVLLVSDRRCLHVTFNDAD